ncbi:MAG: hypothetical protein SFY80_08090 [Verrucomicrobiota bacterium]|nr:hypothetical protein [Verrucomicrobiota bacterium]
MNPAPDNSPRTEALLDALLSSKQVQPTELFNEKTIAAIRASSSLTGHADAVADALLKKQSATTSPEFTAKVLAQLRNDTPSTSKTIRFPGTPAWLLRSTAIAASLLLCVGLWHASRNTQPAATPGVVALTQPHNTVAPASTKAPSVTNESNLEEVLLLAEGLGDARPLLDTDLFTALAVMAR